MPNILRRVCEHKKSLGAVLSAGLARGHRGSPAAALRVHQLHCTPVLFSGLATLVLNKSETKVIDQHYQHTIQNIQRLHQKTPRCITFFLAGCLPGEALLHMRQLSLFSMICHLPEDPLHHHAKYVLSTLPPSCLSWFHQVRNLCLQYSLPHPLVLLDNPVSKYKFKKLVKLQVTEFWHGLLATECTSPQLSSLRYFDPYRASILHAHPVWTSTAGNCFETSKATVLARMMTGRYRTEMLCRFWSTNRTGECLSPTCANVNGTLEHLLISCPALEHIRHRLHSLWCLKTLDCPPLHSLIMRILGSDPEVQMRFILDTTACPQIIQLVQAFGQEIQDRVLYLTRTWAFAMHKHKLKLLGRWPEHQKAKRITGSSTSDDQFTQTKGFHSDYSNNSESNVISNIDIFSATAALPHSSTTPPPTITAPAPTGCAFPQPGSTTTLASTSIVPYDVELHVPDLVTTVHRDQPQDSVPGPTSFTTSNSSHSVNHVVGVDKNLTGHGKGHGVTDCSPDRVSGHQHPESSIMSVSLSVIPPVKTVTRAVSIS